MAFQNVVPWFAARPPHSSKPYLYRATRKHVAMRRTVLLLTAIRTGVIAYKFSLLPSSTSTATARVGLGSLVPSAGYRLFPGSSPKFNNNNVRPAVSIASDPAYLLVRHRRRKHRTTSTTSMTTLGAASTVIGGYATTAVSVCLDFAWQHPSLMMIAAYIATRPIAATICTRVTRRAEHLDKFYVALALVVSVTSSKSVCMRCHPGGGIGRSVTRRKTLSDEVY